MCDVALSFRESLGGENPIKITTGGAGGDDSHGCTTMSAATNCGQIDVIAAHKYGGPESSNADQWTNSVNNWYSKVNGKLLFIEEWGANQALASAVTDWPAQADDIINSGVPNVYWQLVPAENSACPYNPATDSGDEYSIFVNGNVNVGSIVAKANAASAKQDWSAIVPGT
ncbi:hypothetical protein F5Y16DRAFT_102736 [Xylariaceae sp. FL0255]|nr:hypothetical protein F5Y16DRAFT_102736 [Xylariaceae sp. FL0255]